MAESTGCPRCGGTSPGIGKPGLCPSCLLGLALDASEGPDEGDHEEAPAPVYRVLTLLGSETGRTTYLAEQEGTRRLLTLDVVRTSGLAGGDEPGCIDERVRALRAWAHPAVPRVIDGRRTGGGDYCVVAQYAGGPPLDAFCRSRRLDGPSRARLFARVCEAVADGHAHGVCHGRLRPDLVVAAAAAGEIVPLVLGYSIPSGRLPTVDDDIAALDRLARAMGWEGPGGKSWPSVADLLSAASVGWPAAIPAGNTKEENGG